MLPLHHTRVFLVAGPGLEPGTSAYETDEIAIFYASRNFIFLLVIPTGFEPVTPILKVWYSKPAELRDHSAARNSMRVIRPLSFSFHY